MGYIEKANTTRLWVNEKNILLANSHGSVNVDVYFQVILKIHMISLYSSHNVV